MFSVTLTLAIFVVSLACRSVSPQGIDEIIAGAYTAVDEFDQLADAEGSLIRQELDMMLTREQAQALNLLHSTKANRDDQQLNRKRRKAIRSLNYRWTNKVIPYTIQRNTFSDSERKQIEYAISEWRKYTCINFRPANSRDNNKIHFDNGKGCYSYVGMTRTGSQKIGLASGCRFKGVIVHEMGHAVGFHHEQNRPDRDNYVRIVKENIPDALYYNFKKYPESAVDTMDIPYDVTSIMHYGKMAFTKNGRMTIRTVDSKDQNKIGNRKGLSYLDIMMANKMYKCSEHCNQNIQCPKGAFLGKDCKCWCPGYPVTQCASTGTIATTTTGPTQSTTEEGCMDKNKYCGSWADGGYCDRNSYVKVFCKESCGLCSGVARKSSCKDLNKNCDYWGRSGYCAGDFESFMSENCPKTCQVCGSTNEDPEGEGEGTNSDLTTTTSPGKADITKTSLLLLMLSYFIGKMIKNTI